MLRLCSAGRMPRGSVEHNWPETRPGTAMPNHYRRRDYRFKNSAGKTQAEPSEIGVARLKKKHDKVAEVPRAKVRATDRKFVTGLNKVVNQHRRSAIVTEFSGVQSLVKSFDAGANFAHLYEADAPDNYLVT